jgi:molybdate transport system substrate-binding protein
MLTWNLAARSLWTAFAFMLSLAPVGCSDNKNDVPLDASTTPVDAPADAAALSPVDALPDAPASLSLFSAGATQPAVMAAVPGFAAQNGLTIHFTFGSVGSLRDQILTGTSGADVAIVTPAIVTALDAQSFVHAGSRVDLAQVGAGLAVRTADQPPDISDSDKFKAVLLAADEIYYADPMLATAGMAFMRVCTTLGIAATCAAAPNGKGHIAAGGAEAMAAMAISTATNVVGCTQISEIKSTPGVKLVGEYPAAPMNLQVRTVYTAIIVEGTPNLTNAQLLVSFLSGGAFMAQLAMYGFEPVADQ